MQMPAPTDHHRKLAALAGDWVGEATLYPSPWSPEARTVTGRFAMRMAIDGLFLVSDYEEERAGKIVFRGHGVYGWDPKRDRFTMFWFDSMGGSPNETTGVWEDNKLVFTNKGEMGQGRYTYTLHDAGSFGFSIATSKDGHVWTPLMDGAFGRVGN